MGANFCPWNDNKEAKEIWDFTGEIAYQNYEVTYANLKGSISIFEEYNKKSIKIK